MRKPKDLYPGQVDETDVGFPDGKAQNDSSPSDTDGTPLEKGWVNDVWGGLQALLRAVSIVPDGSEEKVGSSQIVSALTQLIKNTIVQFTQGAFAFAGTILFEATLQTDASNDLKSGRDLTAARDAAVARDLTVANDATVTRNLGVGGTATLADLEVTGTATIPSFAGPADFADPVTVHALATVDTLIANGTSTFGGKLFLGASSKIVERAVIGVDADHSYTPSQVDVIVIPQVGSLTADRTYTILDTGAVDGMSFEVANQTHGANHKITVTGANLDGSYNLGHVESFCYIKFTRIGGTWLAVNKVAPV